MGTKRPHSSVDGPGQGGGPRDRGPLRKKIKQGRKNPGAEDASLGAMKKRARTIERRLQLKGEEKKAMPANVQNDLERELAALKQRIQESQDKKLRSTMIGRYHMVRFFERQKAQRLVKKLQKRLGDAQDPDEAAKLKSDLHVAQVDLNYAIYHPFMERYVSLYSSAAETAKATGEKPTAELALRAERPPMWKTIEEAMEQGGRSLLRLQNRRPEPEAEVQSKSQKHKAGEESAGAPAATGEDKTKKSGKQVRLVGKSKTKTKDSSEASARTAPDGDESDHESDGGFFEMG